MNLKTFFITLGLVSLCNTSCVQKPKPSANAMRSNTPQTPAGTAQKGATSSNALISGQKKTTTAASVPGATKVAGTSATVKTAQQPNAYQASTSGNLKTPQQPLVAIPKPAVTEERTTTERKIVEIVPIASPDNELKEP
jgi:hypothetical protein